MSAVEEIKTSALPLPQMSSLELTRLSDCRLKFVVRHMALYYSFVKIRLIASVMSNDPFIRDVGSKVFIEADKMVSTTMIVDNLKSAVIGMLDEKTENRIVSMAQGNVDGEVYNYGDIPKTENDTVNAMAKISCREILSISNSFAANMGRILSSSQRQNCKTSLSANVMVTMCQKLVDFSDDQVEELKKLNKIWRLYYWFRVEELIRLAKVQSELSSESTLDFVDLLYNAHKNIMVKVGDYEEYSYLTCDFIESKHFIPAFVAAAELAGLTKNIENSENIGRRTTMPKGVIEIIHSYSHTDISDDKRESIVISYFLNKIAR